MTLEIRKFKMIRDFTVSQPFQILSNISGKHQVFVWMGYIFQSMWLRCAGAKQVEEQTIDLDLQWLLSSEEKLGAPGKQKPFQSFPISCQPAQTTENVYNFMFSSVGELWKGLEMVKSKLHLSGIFSKLRMSIILSFH